MSDRVTITCKRCNRALVVECCNGCGGPILIGAPPTTTAAAAIAEFQTTLDQLSRTGHSLVILLKRDPHEMHRRLIAEDLRDRVATLVGRATDLRADEGWPPKGDV